MFRFRTIYLVPVLAAVLVLLFLTDGLGGAAAGSWLIACARFVVGVALIWSGWRAVSDYRGDVADGEMLHLAASQSPTGAGLALVYRGLVFVALSIVFFTVAGGAGAQDVRTFIPAQAPLHLPTLKALQVKHWPTMPAPAVLAGQIEKESCITLKHSRCWNATSRLKSAREEGAGMPQITRTWRADGSLRFDALAEIKALHPELAALNWANVYQLPNLQLLTVVLKNRDNWAAFAGVRDPGQRLIFSTLAYNRGVGGVRSEMRACALTPGCDPQRWTGHVERTCTASRQPLYGVRSACDISRGYPEDVIERRAPKYRGWMA
jgi:hypothetical protein